MNMNRSKMFWLILTSGFSLPLWLASLMLPIDRAVAAAPTGFDFASLPGEIRSSGNGLAVRLDDGQSFRWPQGTVITVFSKEGKNIATVDLSTKIKKETGTEALGLEVEESDLGGSFSSKKKYLAGKKSPKGKTLSASQLKGTPDQGRTKKEFSAQGIPMTITELPNGASLLHIQWPGSVEEDYFDKRRSLITSEQTRKVGDIVYTLKQWTNGSYLRSYQRKEGELQFLYDNGDQSYRYTFLNPKGEVVEER